MKVYKWEIYDVKTNTLLAVGKDWVDSYKDLLTTTILPELQAKGKTIKEVSISAEIYDS